MHLFPERAPLSGFNHNGFNMTNNPSGVNNFSLRIIHPICEHSPSEMKAFMHALAIAHAACGEIEIIDVRDSNDVYEAFSVRAVLEKWGILPPDSERDDVGKLGLKVTKIVREGEAKKIVRHRMEKHPYDMLVIGTREHHGLGALFGQDLAEYLADTFRQTTLYVPAGARPFVNTDTGEVLLKKILIPVASEPPADLSFSFVQMLQHIFKRDSAQLIGLHCGDASKSTPSGALPLRVLPGVAPGRLKRGDAFPTPASSLLSGNPWKEIISTEPVVTAITKAASDNDVDLIIMTTQGRNTLPKKIMGSITEQVLRTSPCPLLSIPVE
jgi:nucleotide-binding universal stress UspA family protein